VAQFRLTRRAESDIGEIIQYTLERWGEDQAARYVDDLESAFELLAKNPLASRACADIAPGLRRFEHPRHVIFYRQTRTGVVVTRILHRLMLPRKRRFTDE
jgi:toxin ParE1/3/4